jgi:hypothetical protein
MHAFSFALIETHCELMEPALGQVVPAVVQSMEQNPLVLPCKRKQNPLAVQPLVRAGEPQISANFLGPFGSGG